MNLVEQYNKEIQFDGLEERINKVLSEVTIIRTDFDHCVAVIRLPETNKAKQLERHLERLNSERRPHRLALVCRDRLHTLFCPVYYEGSKYVMKRAADKHTIKVHLLCRKVVSK